MVDDSLIAGLGHDWPGTTAKEPEAVPSVEAGATPLPPPPWLEPVSYSFHIDADLAAVENALYAASQELPTVGLEADGVPTGGTITYGPLRPATDLEPRWGDERFNTFLELPETITWRTSDGREELMRGALTYLGVRRLSDRRVKVRVIVLNRNQLSVMSSLLARLEKDYPGIVDQLDRKMRDPAMPLTPASASAQPAATVTTDPPLSEVEAARLHSSLEQRTEQGDSTVPTRSVVPDGEITTKSVYVPTRPSHFNRWCAVWELIERKVGRETYKDIYKDLKAPNASNASKAMARLSGTDTLPKIVAAGLAGLLDRKVERK